MAIPTYNSTSLTYNNSGFTFDGSPTNDLTNLPALGVFIAFDDEPSVGDPDWEEVTQYVRNVSISRGRSDDYSQFQTGTAQVLLNNRDRRFDPFYTSGVYYGKLLPRRQIKIVANADDETFILFRGYVAGFPVKWTGNGADAVVQVDCFDSFGLLAAAELPPDWAYTTISALNPRRWFRFDDPNGSTVFKDIGFEPRPISLVSGDLLPLKAPALAAGYQYESAVFPVAVYGQGSKVTSLPNKSFSFCGWFRVNNLENTEFGLSTPNMGLLHRGVIVDLFFYNFTSISPAKTFKGWYANFVYQGTDSYKQIEFDDGAGTFVNTPQHLAITFNVNTQDLNVYLNGEPVANPVWRTIAGTYGEIPNSNLSLRSLIAQDIFDLDVELTAAQVKQIYQSGIGAIPETTAVRADRILDQTNLPTELINITDSPVATVSQLPVRGYALPALFETADSEGGEVFVDREGVLQFVNRWYSFGSDVSATVQATFDESNIPYADTFEIMYDADSIRNQVAVQFSGGGEVSASEDASIAAYGKNDYSIKTALSSIDQAQGLADLEASISSVLKPTISPIQVGNTRVASQWAAILGLDVLHRIQVNRTPPSGNAISQTMLVNSLRYDCSPDAWKVTIQGSSRLTGWFTADVSLLDGSDVLI